MKAIIRFLLFVLTFSVFTFTATAQSARENNQRRLTREQLAEMQAKHIARNLAFDEATTKRFIETYSLYQSELWALGPRSQSKRNLQSDSETEQMLKNRFAQSQKILDLRKKYYAIYSEFLTQAQIERVYQLERQMMRHLAKRAGRVSGKNGVSRPNQSH